MADPTLCSWCGSSPPYYGNVCKGCRNSRRQTQRQAAKGKTHVPRKRGPQKHTKSDAIELTPKIAKALRFLQEFHTHGDFNAEDPDESYPLGS